MSFVTTTQLKPNNLYQLKSGKYLVFKELNKKGLPVFFPPGRPNFEDTFAIQRWTEMLSRDMGPAHTEDLQRAKYQDDEGETGYQNRIRPRTREAAPTTLPTGWATTAQTIATDWNLPLVDDNNGPATLVGDPVVGNPGTINDTFWAPFTEVLVNVGPVPTPNENGLVVEEQPRITQREYQIDINQNVQQEQEEIIPIQRVNGVNTITLTRPVLELDVETGDERINNDERAQRVGQD